MPSTPPQGGRERKENRALDVGFFSGISDHNLAIVVIEITSRDIRTGDNQTLLP